MKAHDWDNVPTYLNLKCSLESDLLCGDWGFAHWYDETRKGIFEPRLPPHGTVSSDYLLLEEYFNQLNIRMEYMRMTRQDEVVKVMATRMATRMAIDAADSNVRERCRWTCDYPIGPYECIPSFDRQKVIQVAERVLGADFVDFSTMTESSIKCDSMLNGRLLPYLLEGENSHFKGRTMCDVKLILQDGYAITEQCQEFRHAVMEMPLPLEIWIGGIPIASVCLCTSILLFAVTIIATQSSRDRSRRSENRKERAERKLRDSLEDPFLRSSLQKRLENQYGASQAEFVLNKLQTLANRSLLERQQDPIDIAWKQEEGRRNAREQTIRLVWTVRKILVGWFCCHFLFVVIDWFKVVTLLDSMIVLSFAFVISYIFLPHVKEEEAPDVNDTVPLTEPLLGNKGSKGIDLKEECIMP